MSEREDGVFYYTIIMCVCGGGGVREDIFLKQEIQNSFQTTWGKIERCAPEKKNELQEKGARQSPRICNKLMLKNTRVILN